MKEAFIEWQPNTKSRVLLGHVEEVLEEYGAQGYRLTLRQLYYQLVARDLIPNKQEQYKRLGELVTNARMAGFVDWFDIVDRGRNPIMPPQWKSPKDILEAAINGYRLDRWQGQEYHVEVWCEKDALSSVLEPIANRYHIRFLANKGYSSSTAMYDAAKRFIRAARAGKTPVVVYLGDHDPSGMDMTRDIRDRLEVMGWGEYIEVERLALNFDQIQTYDPPPNPVKFTDSRATGYTIEYGDESWELDALEPGVLDTMVSEAVDRYLDQTLYDGMVALEEEHKDALRDMGERWEEENGEDAE